MPCGFQTMSDNSLRNRTWAGSFKSPPWSSRLEFSLWNTILFASVGDNPRVSTMDLLHFHDGWRFPCAFAGRKDRRRRFLRPVESQNQIDQVVRRWEQIALFVCARAVFVV